MQQEKNFKRQLISKDTDNHYAPLVVIGEFPTIREATQWLVSEAMRKAGNNQSIAAGLLVISQQALSKRLKKECR
jgi:DNA-binding protein Fis